VAIFAGLLRIEAEVKSEMLSFGYRYRVHSMASSDQMGQLTKAKSSKLWLEGGDNHDLKGSGAKTGNR
jgi:hypothetical protein